MNTYHDVITLIRNTNILIDKRAKAKADTAEYRDLTDKIIDMETAIRGFQREFCYTAYRFKRSGHWYAVFEY